MQWFSHYAGEIVWQDDIKEIPMMWKLLIAVHVQQIVVNAERKNTYMLREAFIFQVRRAYDHQCHSQIYEQYNLHQRFQMVLAFESALDSLIVQLSILYSMPHNYD